MPNKINPFFLFLLSALLLVEMSCDQTSPTLKPISVAEFERFVDETNYITDAEKYGWSIVQINIHDFETRENATWQKPNSIDPPESKFLPVTQVSYNDALAYCQWSGQRLPTYDEYWDLIKSDTRIVVSENIMPISSIDDVNVLGNVWEITQIQPDRQVRLAGGSLLCSVQSCNGTVKERELYVDAETGNVHIGFAVVIE